LNFLLWHVPIEAFGSSLTLTVEAGLNTFANSVLVVTETDEERARIEAAASLSCTLGVNGTSFM
jgi:hypothetical protein